MILDRIAASTRARVDRKKREISLIEMKKRAMEHDSNDAFSFESALSKKGIHFICEVKKASPSRGLIVHDFPYLDIAKEYEQAGAAAISVLTEPEYFMGNDDHLTGIKKTVSVPILRKDFVIDEYQLYEAKTIGAQAVLLICLLLSTEILREYIYICDELGLSALVEVHDEREIDSALYGEARIIGVNNRNLKNFTVDIHNSLKLRKSVPENVLFVAESGIRTAADIQLLRKADVNGVLIGEALMKSTDKGSVLRELRGDCL